MANVVEMLSSDPSLLEAAKTATVVIAPSGAGKSVAVEQLKFGTDVDQLPHVHAVYRHLADMFGSKWWDNPKHIHPKHIGLDNAFRKALRDKEPTPLWTAEIGAFELLIKSGVVAADEILLLLPGPLSLTENQTARSTTSKRHPAFTIERNREIVKYFSQKAKQLGIRVIAEGDTQVAEEEA